jgi:hypothetical protein
VFARIPAGDSLFLHYSGHGSQVPDENGDEESGFDSTICPCDYETAGQIIDDDIFALVAAPIPKGAELFALMDCCHSVSTPFSPQKLVPLLAAASPPAYLCTSISAENVSTFNHQMNVIQRRINGARACRSHMEFQTYLSEALRVFLRRAAFILL